MPSFFDLAEAIWTQLEARAAYPLAEVFANGLNPAMRLLTLAYPDICTLYTPVTLAAYSGLLDLRLLVSRTVRVRRVLLGQAASDVALLTQGQFTPLQATERTTLARLYPNWLTHIRMPEKYFLLGRQQVYIWPRPPSDIACTLVCASVPTAATLDNQTQAPDLDSSCHDQLIDLAVHLLRLKEGQGEAEESQQRLAQVLGLAAKTPPASQTAKAGARPLTERQRAWIESMGYRQMAPTGADV